MNSVALEAFLARIYTDEALLTAFLQAPEDTARAAGLDAVAIAALCAVDRDSLIMAARSFRAKRGTLKPCGPVAKARCLMARVLLGPRRY